MEMNNTIEQEYTLERLLELKVSAVLIDNQRFTNVQGIYSNMTVTVVDVKVVHGIQHISSLVVPINSLELEFEDGSTQTLVDKWGVL